MIKKVIKKEQTLISLFNIVNSNRKIIVLFTTEVCLIYDDEYDPALVERLSVEIEFEKFNRFQFAGSRKTIESLFRINNARYELQKHRVAYKCCELNPLVKISDGKIQMADPRRIDELIALSQGFSKAYYDTNKSYEDAYNTVARGIETDTLYQWMDNDKVCAIAQCLNDEYSYPVIGHFFTRTDLRCNGYGTSLIYEVTRGLLGAGHELVMLQTNALTPASNRVFEKVGYKVSGEYILAYKLS